MPFEIGSSSIAGTSSSFHRGHAAATSGVAGPMEVRLRDEQIQTATLDVSVNGLDGIDNVTLHTFAATLKELFSGVILLHLYPRSLLRMTSQLTAISDTVSGSHANWARAPPIMHRKYNLSVSQKSASINASSMAVLSAGLSCRCTLVSACCVAVVDRDRRRTGRLNFVTEPTAQEESKSASQWLFAFAFFGRDPLQESGQTEPDVGVESVLCEASGGFSEEQTDMACAEALEAARATYKELRELFEHS